MKRFSRIIKSIMKFTSRPWVRILLLFAIIFIICAACGAFNSLDALKHKIMDVISSGDIIVTFLIAAASLIVASITMFTMKKLEDSYKLEDDKKKIIIQYSDHKRIDPDPLDANLYTPDGALMYLSSPPQHKRWKPHNYEKKNTEAREQFDGMVDHYMFGTRKANKKVRKPLLLTKRARERAAKDQTREKPKSYALFLPGVNLFANIDGKTSVRFEDVNSKVIPPDFVRENALALMGAHKNSSYSNNETIRLGDVTYNAESNELVLHTMRTQYFDMLITNRCMDFKLNGLVSVRDIYESGKRISHLNESLLSNQIGINGLIFTSDGYLLIEKRDYKKVVWKGKLAQPISLAMKKSAVEKLMKDGRLTASPYYVSRHNLRAEHEYASEVFKKIILKTIADNFGITENDIREFDISRNLFGIAQDLLEGGKPNIYFYVVVNKTAKECKEMLEERAKISSSMSIIESKERDELPNLTRDKLGSDYYLISRKDIGIDFHYRLKVKAKKVIKVNRKFPDRVKAISAKLDGLAYRTKKRLGLNFSEECCEALLTCFYYMDVCHDRLDKEFS